MFCVPSDDERSAVNLRPAQSSKAADPMERPAPSAMHDPVLPKATRRRISRAPDHVAGHDKFDPAILLPARLASV